MVWLMSAQQTQAGLVEGGYVGCPSPPSEAAACSRRTLRQVAGFVHPVSSVPVLVSVSVWELPLFLDRVDCLRDFGILSRPE